MSGIAERGTTYDLPNYVGELFGLSPSTTRFLSAIGGLTGGEDAGGTTEISWQSYDLRTPSAMRQRKEGQDAPEAAERVRANHSNLLEIHQEAVDLSYTKLSAVNLLGTAAAGVNPVRDELTWQIQQQIKQVALDCNESLINGTYHKPNDNNTARRTRGLLEAISTNAISAAGVDTTDAAEVREHVLDLVQEAWDNGGMNEDETRALLTNSSIKRLLSWAFIEKGGYTQTDRNIGGVNVTAIETDFGTLNIMLERQMPVDTLAAVSLEVCAPVLLETPDKGHFFVEPLAKTGASERAQLYCEIGLKYGSEIQHAKSTDWDVDGGS